MKSLKLVVEAEHNGKKLGNYLRQKGFSAHAIKSVKYIANGICVNNEQSFTNRIVCDGDIVTISFAEESTTVLPEEIPVDICYEDEVMMLINKPAGLLVHPTGKYQTGTLAGGYIALMQKRGESSPVFRPVMRLDRNTSGLIMVAKNSYGAAAFRNHVQKTYVAVAEGEMEEAKGVINLPISYAAHSFIKQSTQSKSGKPSITEFEVQAVKNNFTLLKVWPKTGRTHQIRVHLASIGHPLAGDDLYGGHLTEIERHALHCENIRFLHPLYGKTIEATAPLPKDMQKVKDKLFP